MDSEQFPPDENAVRRLQLRQIIWRRTVLE